MSPGRVLTCTPPQVVHSPPGVGDWRVETALELRLYGLACLESDNTYCQTPAGQRPQSVVFKLRSRLGDSARPEQSTTRQICLRLPVAQPTAVGDAPLRISRAAGYGERYGRAAGTQDKKKELSSYAFRPMSNLFRRIYPWLPSSMSVEIFNENHPVRRIHLFILFDVLVASAYYIESCCTCVLLIIDHVNNQF